MKYKELLIENLFDMEETIAGELFEGKEYPWEVLPEIGGFIQKLGSTLPAETYQKLDEDIWVANSAQIAPTASLHGPCIIGPDTEVRPGAFIRGNALVGENCVVGNSTELKNVVLFNHVQVPHYNYVGDSILGYCAHMGAGSITSNVKSDKTNVTIRCGENVIETGYRKMGAVLGDHVEVGCNSVLNPGTIIGRHTNVYPLSMVRGYLPEKSIYKRQGEIVEKREDSDHA